MPNTDMHLVVNFHTVVTFLTPRALQKAGQAKASMPVFMQDKDQMFDQVKSRVHALELTSSSFIHIRQVRNIQNGDR